MGVTSDSRVSRTGRRESARARQRVRLHLRHRTCQGCGRTSIRRPHPLHRPWRTPPLSWLLGILVMLPAAFLQAQQIRDARIEPSVYLDQATIHRARALALDAALSKGWRVVESTTDYSVFETLIHESADQADSELDSIPVLLRIHTAFIRDAGGVRVGLTATEIRSPGTEAENRRDVTEDYRANLYNALSSLRRQWEVFALGGRVSHQPPGTTTTVRRAHQQSSSAPDTLPSPVGRWAHEAEAVANLHGCQVAAQGAVLLGDRARRNESDHETHRVACDNRSAMLVRCDSETCQISR